MIDPDRIARMGQAALDVLEDKAAGGDTQAAKALSDYAVAQHRGKLSVSVQLPAGGLSTMDDVLEASTSIMLMALGGSLTFVEAEKAMSLLTQYANLRAFDRLEELSQMVEDMKAQAEDKVIVPSGIRPTWGRLSDDGEAKH